MNTNLMNPSVGRSAWATKGLKGLLVTTIVTVAGLGWVSGAAMAANTITTVAGTGVAGLSGDGAAATAAQINLSEGVAVDSAGNIYIADTKNNVVRKVDTAGIITTFAGGGAGLGDNGQATAGTLSNPEGVAVDTAGNVYIADSFNNRIRKVDTAGVITTVAGSGGALGDGGPATAAQLRVPTGVTFDPAGNLIISEFQGSRIRKVDSAGVITTIAGNGTNNGANGSAAGDGGQATAAQLGNPTSAVYDSAGNLYIADTGVRRVRKVDTAGVITTVAGTLAAGFSGDGGQATAAQLDRPTGIVFDKAGNYYISARSNNRVRKVDTSGVITTFAGGGGTLGDGGPATAAQLNNPYGIAIDSAGNFYVTDTNNNRIRKIVPNKLPKLNNATFTTPLNVAFSQQLAGSDADAGDTLTYTLTAGSTLPATLTLSSAGLITGTPTTTGNISFSVDVTDGTDTITSKFIIVVSSAADGLGPVVTRPAFLASYTRDQLAALSYTGTIKDVAQGAVTPTGVSRLLFQLRQGNTSYSGPTDGFTSNVGRGYYAAFLDTPTPNTTAGDRLFRRTFSTFIPPASVLTPGSYSIVIAAQDVAGNYSVEVVPVTITAPTPPAANGGTQKASSAMSASSFGVAGSASGS